MQPVSNIQTARAVQEACIKAAREAFEDAATRGLCMEGAVEASIGAIRSLDLYTILEELENGNS